MTMPRRILISGASRGLGRALVDHFLQVGDLVFGCSRGESNVVDDRYVHIRADVTNEADVELLFRTIRKETKQLDCLVNNAGVGRMLPTVLTPLETARRLIDVNLLGTFQLTNQAIRLLRRSSAARIVNLTTVAVPLRLEGEAMYAATKSAVETFTRILAKEIGPMGITCNAVGPSPIRTDLIRNVPDEKLNKLIEQQAIRKWAEPDDLVNVVEFFLRPESKMVTGQTIYLGGIS